MKNTEKFYRFIGLPRCGNHPIIFWLLHQVKDMRYDGEEQYSISSSSRFYRPDVRLSECAWMKPCPNKDGIVCLFNNRNCETGNHVDGKLSIDEEISDIKHLTKMADVKPVNKVAIFSYELESLKDLSKHHPMKIDSVSSFLGKVGFNSNIIVMRDAYNAIASRLTMNRLNERPDEDIFNYVENYKTYAQEFLCKTNHIRNKTMISFNRWFRSVTYRKKVLKKLKLHYTDEGKEKVSKIGGGSTWDKKNYQNRASEMDLESRWKNLKNDDFYKSIFKDTLLVDLSNKIFEIDVKF